MVVYISKAEVCRFSPQLESERADNLIYISINAAYFVRSLFLLRQRLFGGVLNSKAGFDDK